MSLLGLPSLAAVASPMIPLAAVGAPRLPLRRHIGDRHQKRGLLVVVAGLNEVRRLIPFLLAALAGPMTLLATVLAFVALGGLPSRLVGETTRSSPRLVAAATARSSRRFVAAGAA